MTKSSSKKHFVISPHSEEMIFGISDADEEEEPPIQLKKKIARRVPTKLCDGNSIKKDRTLHVKPAVVVVHVKSIFVAGSTELEKQVIDVIIKTIARVEKETIERVIIDDGDVEAVLEARRKKKKSDIRKLMVALLSFDLPTVAMKKEALELMVKHTTTTTPKASVLWGIREALEAFLA